MKRSEAIEPTSIFGQEELDNLFYENKGKMKRQLSPIIDQIILVWMQREILPPLEYRNPIRKEEYQKIMDFYIGLIHQLLGYKPTKD
jgi:hypothetical protein